MNVIGLDLSISATGIALADGTCRTYRPTNGPADPSRRLHELVQRIGARIRAQRADLAVIEGYNPRGVQGFTMVRLAELGGAIRVVLHEEVIPFVEIAPKSLKLFAAGDGDATKTHMMNAARALGATVENDNEADAWLLRCAALQHYQRRPDWPTVTRSIERLPWPVLEAAA